MSSRFYGHNKWGTTAVTLTLGTGLTNVFVRDDEVHPEHCPAFLTQVSEISQISQTRVVASTIEEGELVPAADSWAGGGYEYIGTALIGTDEYDALVATAQDRADQRARLIAMEARVSP